MHLCKHQKKPRRLVQLHMKSMSLPKEKNGMITFLCISFLAIKIGEKRDISVITKGCGKADGPVKVTMITPSKKKVNIPVKESLETWKGQLVPTEVGQHTIEVTYGSFSVPKSPFTVNVTSAVDLNKDKVVGLDKRKWVCCLNSAWCFQFLPTEPRVLTSVLLLKYVYSLFRSM